MIYQAEVFTRACAELGIRHLSAKTGRPEGKGKIERWFATFQNEFLPELSLHPVQTLEALNERLWAWIEEAYHVRTHSETGEPPAERFLRDLERRTVPPERLQRVFLWREDRQVDKTGVIQFAGNRYQAPAGTEHAQRAPEVELRYHPLRLEELEVWREGRFAGKARPLDLYRSRLDRVARAHEPAAPKRTGLPYLELLLHRHEERKRQALSPLQLHRPEPGKEGEPRV
ncbi:Mu transposase C-terminal domain-containing protein [Limnochorda pilosa]|uniref:Transposase n=1 Tax=Limnochorda pilosa TaxID=1555112 RepID=A0A0K2SJ25_LIMPI|nr:Mu transposase C-terminal domain-containing protein [Limnochorda pilosa]BAS27090.1 transposase [Limnochorda pilosa]